MAINLRTGVVAWIPVVAAFAAAAQTPDASWEAELRRLPVDTRIRADLDGGRSVTGRLGDVSENRVEIERHGSTVGVTRDEVARIYRAVARSRRRDALIGAIVGGAGGGGVGAKMVSGRGSDLNRSAAPTLAVLGAAGGAVIGYLIGRREEFVLVYERAARGPISTGTPAPRLR